MILHTFITFVGFLAGLSSAASSGVNGTRLGPVDLSKVQNSTKHEFDLGTTPTAPYGEKQSGEEWATPLVNGCPRLCATAGPDGAKWTHVHSVGDLKGCDVPLLFDLNVHAETVEAIRVCALGSSSSFNPPKAAAHLRQHKGHGAERRQAKQTETDSKDNKLSSSQCSPAPLSPVPVIVTSGLPGVLNATEDVTVALQGLKQHITKKTSCGKTVLFSKVGSAIVGLYVSAYMGSVAATAILERFETVASLRHQPMNPYPLGIFAVDKINDFELVRKNVQTWTDGYCAAMPLTRPKDARIPVSIPGGDLFTDSSNATSSVSGSGLSTDLEARTECAASEAPTLSSTIRSRTYVAPSKLDTWCAAVPGRCLTTPKADPDGTCATHKIDTGDTCASVAAASSITVKDIETYNKNSWAWADCNRLQLGQVICLSKGNMLMSLTHEGIACGPQKSGNEKPSGSFDGWDLAKLNQCPLNSCCSGWGFCGTTTEFCTESPADTKALGAFKVNTNGCISNCGTDIVNNKSPPKEFRRIGYFEAYNPGRPCMHMDTSEIAENFEELTHVHFAFAGITANYNVNIPEHVKKQFDIFDKMDAPFKKILSFGGWAESTDAGTFQRYRDVVKPEHRSVFVTNVVKFLEKHSSFDGVDIDWEYPGATDQGIPAGDRTEGVYYTRFLTVLRNLLPSSKSLSIALPGAIMADVLLPASPKLLVIEEAKEDYHPK
ncbi:related to chitinase [Fusarium torulosum]|uniref:Related to chitinase n=1 Tax=Fusarium torulosum TaxID=33205 RepID=A0AAE8SH80_9HYPO|nr:related to chitinase [Fusarium torulosum]